MFAFAHLGLRRKRRLLLARDRLGVKPVFYRLEPGRLVFASELRALRELCRGRLKSTRNPIYDFFGFRYIPAPQTFYRGVEKLLPGHFLVADASGVQTPRLLGYPAGRRNVQARRRTLPRKSSSSLRESVRLRLIADVPLGVFLSGGTDSSAVVALMAELGARPLRTFSVGFDEPEYSELPLRARRGRAAIATEHQETHRQAGALERRIAAPGGVPR